MYSYSPKDKVREVTKWPGRVMRERGMILQSQAEDIGLPAAGKYVLGTLIIVTGSIACVAGDIVALGVDGVLWVFGSTDATPLRLDPTIINKGRAKENFEKGRIHIAVCGQSGSGKSSVINALRGIQNSQVGAAPTGTTETTQTRSTYHAHESICTTTLHDLPGGGTRRAPIEDYYNNQKLYLFDFLLVIHSGRLGQLDIETVKNCLRIRQPFLIIRSKSDESINAIINDTGLDQEAAKLNHLRTTFTALRTEFIESGVPEEIVEALITQCILINNQALRECVLGQGRSVINELELVHFLREFTTYFKDGRMTGKWWLKQVENGKYLDEQYIGEIELLGDMFLAVTYNRILKVQSRHLTCVWDFPLKHVQHIKKEKAGIKFTMRGGENGPFIQIEDGRERSSLYQMLGVAAEQIN
ncbi:interferon-inducible GTPase-domain-containing protein, partial [Fusarium oxysporum II5]